MGLPAKGVCWRTVWRPTRLLEMLACLLLLLSLASLLYIVYYRHLHGTAPLPVAYLPWAPSPLIPHPDTHRQNLQTLQEDAEFHSSGSEPSIPVYVVEEHHEVLKYWFAAAERGLIPKHGNIVFHIDGHSDAGFPYDNSIIPLFRWPKDYSEVRGMMQANDVFIVGAAIAGLVGRYVWVWPPWDAESGDDHPRDYDAFNMTLGTGYRDIPSGGKVVEICGCATMVGVEEERRCFMFNSSSDNPTEEPITIRASVCTMRTQGLVEMVSERKAVELVEKGGWISPTDNIILDIDEDYYGCEAAVTPLYSTHLKQLVLDVMNAWVAKLACIATSHEERQLDSLYHHLLQRLVTTKQFCNQGYLPPSVCGSAASLMNATSIQEDTLAEFSARGLSSCQSPQMQKFILRRIIVFLWKMEIPQLKALAEVGICFTMSPKSTHFDKIVSVKICDGYNRPNNTMVLFHTPGLEEVAERTRQLAWVLHWGPVKPRLVTLCRSTRDGYTPRALFRRIEDDVLHVLERAFRGIRPDTVTYDPDLLGGPYGWYSRH